MKKLYKKVENWLWVILLIGALICFQQLVGNLRSENKRLEEFQRQFSQEIEEKYQRNKQLQVEIQAQLNKAAQNLLEVLQSVDPAQRGDPKSY